MTRTAIAGAATVCTLAALGTMTLLAQRGRMPSPAGMASTEIRGKYNNSSEPAYLGGKWIEIRYGRPIKRGRDLWGSGASYGKNLNAGAPVSAAALASSARAQNAYAAVDDASIATRTVGKGICQRVPRVGAFATQPWNSGSPCAPAAGY